MPQGRISSSLTGVYKYALVPLWVTIYGFPTVKVLIGGPAAFGDQTPRGWLVWTLWSVLTAWLVYFAIRLRFVHAYIDSLRITTLSSEVFIQPTQLIRADQFMWAGPPVVRLFYRTSAGRERTAWFIPRFLTGNRGLADPNLVPDLNAFAQRSSTPAA